MTKRIFRGIFFASIIVMLACLIFVIGFQYQFYADAQAEALKSKAYLIAQGIEDSDSYIESIKDSEERITLINTDGTVIYDNRADASAMENHLDRKEVSEAFKSGTGVSVRHSSTLSKQTCYYAVKLEDGRVIRVADERLTVLAMLPQLLQPICAVIIGALIISLLFAATVTRHILKPVNAIDVESPEIDSDYDELSPLINKIKLQNRRIESQIERLNQNRNEFNIISDNMSEGLILTDKSGNIISCNKSAAGFFKANDSLAGKNILTLNRREIFRTVIEKVSTGIHFEGRFDEDGRVFEVAGNPVFDDKNNLCGAVILVLDITEKENREKLRREFTANVSHELKTPLTSIYGIADMLRSGLVSEKDVKGFAEDISKESLRLISLVNDIIRLSQLDEGISDEKPEGVTDLKAVADEVCDRIQPIADKSRVNIVKKLENAEINGAYESLIFEMIYNLCDNAVKYNKPNGSITVSTGRADSGKTFIKISDTGIGIPAEDTERIFERFYRVDKSRSKEIGGTGLGLSIVKHIAASTGGVVSVKSQLGIGTEITVEYE